MTERRVPDVLLERFLADDLGDEMRRRIESDERPEVRGRLDELRAERQAFLEADPPAEFARRLAGRLETEGAAAAAVAAAPARPRRWIAWLLGPSVAAAAAAALVVTFTVTRQPADAPTAVLMDPAPQATSDVSAGAASATPAEEAEKPFTVTEPLKKARADTRRPKARKRKKPDRPAKVGAKTTTAKPPPPPKPAPTPEPEEEPALDEVAMPAVEAAPSAPSAAGSAGGSARERKITSSEIVRAIRDEMPDIQACMKASEEVPAGEYTLTLTWTVTARGRVAEPRLVKPKSLRDTALSRCLLREMRTWRFRSTGSSREVTVPIQVEVK